MSYNQSNTKEKNIKTPLLIINFLFILSGGLSFQSLANPITVENLLPGSRTWILSRDTVDNATSTNEKAATDAAGQIKGFLSATSVNKGGQIDFKVTVNPVQNFTIEIYRAGYYAGNGARLVTTIGPLAGVTQPACPRDESTGLIECNWSTSYTLTIPQTWTSGVYLAKLKNANRFTSGAIFVVRDDSQVADILYKQPVNTYQAYNQYPENVNGKSLYGNMLGETPAYKVSYNRPYAGYLTGNNGYSDFPHWELQTIKWLEKEGYDVTYTTDVDFHANPGRILNYRSFISPGHDEYWTKESRDAAELGRANKVNLAFLGANAVYWQARLEPSTINAATNRNLVCYRDAALDPITDQALKTVQFRSATLNRPEQTLLGLQYTSYNSFWKTTTYTDLIVKNSSHWVYRNTGLIDGSIVPKIIGYEVDMVHPTAPLPANTEYTILAESPFHTIYNTDPLINSVIYKTPQGGWVFSAGTMSWSWALEYDAFLPFFGDVRSTALQKVTKNILDRFNGYNSPPTGQPVIAGLVKEDQVLTVDTSTINDINGLGVFSYQWKRNGINIAGATTSSYQLGDGAVGNFISVSVSYTDGWDKLETLTSATTAAVINVNDAPTGAVTISGTPNIGVALAASNNLNDADGLGSISYQWLRNGVNIAGAVASTYTLVAADSGAQISVAASYTDGHGTAERVVSAAVSMQNQPPVGLPVIVGTVQENQTITVNTSGISDADGLGAFSYQWKRNGIDISGATANSYLLGDGAVGNFISVSVSYTDGRGKLETVTSATSAAVINVNDVPIGGVTISGTPNIGATLTATNNISDADGLGTISYQWLRNGTNIAGAVASTYTLVAADSGAQISVAASYTDGHGTAERVVSAAVSMQNQLPVGLPVIVGTVQENQLLTVNISGISDADGLGAFSYQWLRNGLNITGATANSYVPGDADVGTLLSVKVSYTDGVGKLETVTSATSAAVINVNDAPIGGVTISGTPNIGATLTASNNISDADGLGTISYQWLRNGVNIAGAIASTYTLVAADSGAQISVAASYTDGRGTAERVISAAVTTLNQPPVGVPVIVGTALENQLLTVNTSGISDADGLGAFSYQWQRNGINISGAIANNYGLGDADVGTQISVILNYTDGRGKLETLTSAATSPVVNVNDAPIGTVTINGTPNIGATLTASNNISDADGLGSIGYQWLRNGVNIAGAIANNYTLVAADSGAQISVAAIYTDARGTVERVISTTVTVLNQPPSGVPVIVGTAQENQLLTVNTSGISDADGLGAFSYQWLRSGQNIIGATANNYGLGDADVGTQLSVTVSYTDGRGKLETITSASTSAVANINDAPIGTVTISGIANIGAALTASNNISDADGLGTISYQWLRNGANIAGAISSSYVLTSSDAGTQISVVARYIDARGTSENVVSSNVGVPVFLGTKRMQSVYFSRCSYPETSSNNARIRHTTCSTTASNQKWNIAQINANTFKVTNQSSGGVLASSGSSAIVQQSLVAGATNQLWTIQSAPNGSYYLVNASNGSCLSVDLFSSNLIQRSCNTTSTVIRWNLIN